MESRTLHELDHSVRFDHAGVTLFEYVYVSPMPGRESPKPYFHPIRTLKGNLVSACRPHDHPWHTGLSMTFAVLSGQNFWGGPSFVRDKGYEWIDNQGRQLHQDWDELGGREQGLQLAHRLKWINHSNETWLEEKRQWAIDLSGAGEGYWSIDVAMELANVSGKALRFGSPTTEGRPKAGYGSLFWRGPRDFSGAAVLGADGLEGDDTLMGTASPWLAFIGKHDESLDQSTLLFIDRPTNPRYPNKWFVRSKTNPVVSYAFMFDEEYELADGDALKLDYRFVVADGAWERERIEAFVHV